MLAPETEIRAYPTKAFFIDMLTRDIGSVDAILELVDNSIDKAVSQHGLNAMDALTRDSGGIPSTNAKVNISFTVDHLTIEDTSGGISEEELEKKVFVFGNPGEREERSGLGAYGIGMKRAFFKLGRLIEFKTRPASDVMFGLRWDVNTWRDNQEEWNLKFHNPNDLNVQFSHELTGTVIRITNLTDSVKKLIGDPPFQNELMQRLGTTYALFIKCGLQISVNGREIGQSLPEFGTLEDSQVTGRKEISTDDVDILIIVGLTHSSDRAPRGWYIFCNGRTVLEADKSSLTGWGTTFPIFNPKFNHFLGFVYFSSENVTALPWTTTKQGVERESVIYQFALAEMRIQARPVLDYLSTLYQSDAGDAAFQRTLLDEIKPVPVYEIGKQDVGFRTPVKPPGPKMTSIQYSRTEEEVNRVKRALGNPRMSNVRVGEATFEYFVERELD